MPDRVLIVVQKLLQRRAWFRVGTLAAAVLLPGAAASALLAPSPATGHRSRPAAGGLSVFALANRCFALRSVSTRRFVVAAGSASYAADAPSRRAAAAFFLKPTALGTYLFSDSRGELISIGTGPAGATDVTRSPTAGTRTVFAPAPAPAALPVGAGASAFSIRSSDDHRRLGVRAGSGVLGLTRARTRSTLFAFVPRSGCRQFPEAQVDATVHGGGTPVKHGRIFGFIDDHVHVTGNMRAGGEVISGEPYDRFGIPTALGQDAKIHGANGSLDLTGNLLRSGVPVGTHDTHGWPSFQGWPTYGSMTHQQAYYVWLERAWRAGMRMMVAQTADDAPLCRLEPRRAVRTCSETTSVEAQIATLKGLQNYVDAQSGGPGRGWFRLVYSPAGARRVMRAGKLAVMIGIESSDLFGCSEVGGRARCTRATIDRGLAHYQRLGVRGMFVAHWVNNAFAGAALEGGTKGVFINILNRFQTGSYFQTARCPGAGQGVAVHTLSPGLLGALAAFFPAAKSIAGQPMPAYPSGPQCNSRDLTSLGRYLIRRMMANHMLIEVDHLSEAARDEVLAIAARAHYPLISSHNGTGGEWTPSELIRLYKLGGFAAVTPDIAPTLAAKILTMAKYRTGRGFFGVGLGTDTNGFSSLPGPRPDAGQHPLRYPFKSYDGSVTFTRERTGTRRFDLNRDGVAHYGLIADLIADMQRTSAGRRALPLLFDSAEAYVETWQRAFNA
jgi:microsomal dipeptidase-like Zn-dependent dipeptidase